MREIEKYVVNTKTLNQRWEIFKNKKTEIITQYLYVKRLIRTVENQIKHIMLGNIINKL